MPPPPPPKRKVRFLWWNRKKCFELPFLCLVWAPKRTFERKLWGKFVSEDKKKRMNCFAAAADVACMCVRVCGWHHKSTWRKIFYFFHLQIPLNISRMHIDSSWSNRESKISFFPQNWFHMCLFHSPEKKNQYAHHSLLFMPFDITSSSSQQHFAIENFSFFLENRTKFTSLWKGNSI